MILPLPKPDQSSRQARPANDFLEISLSPREAVQELSKTIGPLPPLLSVSLELVAGTMVYKISTKSGESYLINARTGERFAITAEVAERLARRDYGRDTTITRIELITPLQSGDSWGSLPAYRVEFNDRRATVLYVAVSDGQVFRVDHVRRLVAAIENLHTFGPVRLISDREEIRKGLLLVLAIVGLGVAVTGYYIALPLKWRQRQVLEKSKSPTTR